MAKTPAWQRKAGKSKSGGLNKKGVASYRKANPGSKLKTAVTTKPSKLKKGSKAANRRKSFCARMSGMKKGEDSFTTKWTSQYIIFLHSFQEGMQLKKRFGME